jgi:hypothetical protein
MQGRYQSLRLVRPRAMLIAFVSVVLLAAGASSAGATSDIEGVWSFNGGQIAVRPLSNGTFVGTVVAETKFAECIHPVGQQIWSGMKLQPDGSYDGFHVWYETSACVIDPTPGPTAWLVEQASDGSHFLRACFSTPGTSQPVIAADGSEADVTYGCVSSARIASLPSRSVLSLKALVSSPSTKKCFSRRAFEIHVRDPKHDPFKTILITIAGRKIAVKHKGEYSVAMVKLKGLPRGTFTIKIHATTVLGHVLSGHRTYHTCAKKRSSGKKRHT